MSAEEESASLPLLGLGHMPEWMDRGLCGQTDPESFFPEKGGETRTAKAICAVCPVMAECLDYALDNDERFGIWGGLSERDRRKVKAAIALEAGTDLQCPDCTASFTSEAGMRVHRRSHDRPASADLPCPQCDQICKGQTGLSVHLNHHFLEDAS